MGDLGGLGDLIDYRTNYKKVEKYQAQLVLVLWFHLRPQTSPQTGIPNWNFNLRCSEVVNWK